VAERSACACRPASGAVRAEAAATAPVGDLLGVGGTLARCPVQTSSPSTARRRKSGAPAQVGRVRIPAGTPSMATTTNGPLSYREGGPLSLCLPPAGFRHRPGASRRCRSGGSGAGPGSAPHPDDQDGVAHARATAPRLRLTGHAAPASRPGRRPPGAHPHARAAPPATPPGRPCRPDHRPRRANRPGGGAAHHPAGGCSPDTVLRQRVEPDQQLRARRMQLG